MDRLIARELMDDEGAAAPPVWHGMFRELARVNRFLGGWTALRAEVDRLPVAPQSILDVAAGGADLSARLVQYLATRGVAADCTALDRSQPALDAAARAQQGREGVRFVRGDARRLEFADHSFDLAMMNLALHHFDGADAVVVLRELARVGRRVIVNDLRRSAIAWALASVAFPILTTNPLVRNDAPLSVRRAYTPAELRELAREAGWRTAAVRTHPWYRMTLVSGLA